jgi:hypothetical protein
MVEARPAEGRRERTLAMFVAVLLVPAVLGSSKTIFNDGDVSWHIATGQWILAHRAMPHTDPFSFTWAGKPWLAMEPLADVIFAFTFGPAGYAGVAAVVTTALVALHAIVFFNASRWTRMSLLPIVAMDFLLIPTLLARPHVLIWPLIAYWTWLMLRARERDRAPPLVAALLMALWANLHASFAIGLFIAAAFGLEVLIASKDRLRAFRQWLGFGVACALAVLLNANGLEGVLYPLRYRSFEMLPLIDEWKPSSPSITPFFFGVLAITLALIAWKRPRLHPVRWLLLGTLLLAALIQVRHQAVLGIVAAMILPEGFAKGVAAGLQTPRAPKAWVAVGAALLVVVRAMLPMTPPDSETNPWKLIAAVPAELRSQPVLNGYSMGGPLILSGIRPYIDGRGDMYGDELVVGYSRILGGDRQAFDAAVRRWNIRWAILPRDNKELIALIDRTPGWRRIARDKVGAIYIRTAAAAPSA